MEQLGALRLRATLAIILALAAGSVILSLNRGLELHDESTYIYLLHHPDLVVMFLDHRLWGAVGELFGGGVLVYRVLPLLLVLAGTLVAARGLIAAGGSLGLAANWPRPALYLFAAIGALGYFSVIRSTMNYGVSGLFFGELFVALLLFDLARAPAPSRPALFVALGLLLALLFTARFPATILGLAFLAAYCALRPTARGRAGKGSAFLIAAVATGAGLALLAAAGFDFAGMLHVVGFLAGGEHSPAALLIHDALQMGVVAAFGAAAAAGLWLVDRFAPIAADRKPAVRSLLAAAFVVALILLALVDQRAVLRGAQADLASPYVTNVNLYGSTYFHYALLFFLLALMLIQDGLGFSGDGPRRIAWPQWALVAILLFGTLFSFVGTNTGLMARSGLGSGLLHLLLALPLLLVVAPRRILAPYVAAVGLTGVALLTAIFVFLNTIWSPYNINGRWSDQTVRLERPAALRGLYVSPATAQLQADIVTALARLGYRRGRDGLIYGYGDPGLGLLSGEELASYPNLQRPDLGQEPLAYSCHGYALAMAYPYERIFGLNVEDFSPGLKRCLRDVGVDVASGRLVTVSPYLTVRIMDKRPAPPPTR